MTGHEGPVTADVDYCTDLVRRYDGDRFVACLFAPEDRRPALMALHAFNLEVAKTREVVREPIAGAIRLQWWRDALDEIYGGGMPRRHQVVRPLAAAVHRHRLAREPFDRLLDAREADLADARIPTADALETYAEATSATLTGLALDILGAGEDEVAASAGRHVGIAWALAGLLRAIPFHARARRLYLPEDIARDAGLDMDDLLELRRPAGLGPTVAVLAGRAEAHLVEARRLGRRVPRASLPALMPATIAEAYLKRFQRVGYDPFHPDIARPLASRGWRLLRVRVTGRF